jgi:hypothetical protein
MRSGGGMLALMRTYQIVRMKVSGDAHDDYWVVMATNEDGSQESLTRHETEEEAQAIALLLVSNETPKADAPAPCARVIFNDG